MGGESVITTYYAQKKGMGFFIQPEDIEEYAKLGYTIYKNEPVVVSNIEREVRAINAKAD